MGRKCSLDDLKAEFIRVAALLGKHPRDVTRREFQRLAVPGAANSRFILNALVTTKDILFPITDNPLYKIAHENLASHDMSKRVSALIAECAQSQQVPIQELTWAEFRQFIRMRWGENDKGLAKYVITRVGGFNSIRDAYYPPLPTENLTDKFRLKQHTSLNRKLGTALIDDQFMLDRLQEFAKELFGGLVPPHTVEHDLSKPTKKILNLVLSDLHFGSDIDKSETGSLNYNVRQEARRIAHIVKEVALYKIQDRDISELEILLLGDIFQNNLHDPRDGAVLAEQIARSLHLLGQAINYLGANFKKVRIRCAVGNHGRFTSRHKGRAVHGKFDSAETVLYAALKYACSKIGNVEFFIPKTPYVTYSSFGKKVFATHGDGVLSSIFPGKAIQVGQLENQSNRINASLPDDQEYTVFVVGHVHTASRTHLPNGSILITNGALVPVDPFAISLGIMESQCGQWLWESTEEEIMTDSYFIKVGKKEDNDKSLIEIIKPWESF